jgi:hypothetical protein
VFSVFSGRKVVCVGIVNYCIFSALFSALAVSLNGVELSIYEIMS